MEHKHLPRSHFPCSPASLPTTWRRLRPEAPGSSAAAAAATAGAAAAAAGTAAAGTPGAVAVWVRSSACSASQAAASSSSSETDPPMAATTTGRGCPTASSPPAASAAAASSAAADRLWAASSAADSTSDALRRCSLRRYSGGGRPYVYLARSSFMSARPLQQPGGAPAQGRGERRRQLGCAWQCRGLVDRLAWGATTMGSAANGFSQMEGLPPRAPALKPHQGGGDVIRDDLVVGIRQVH